MPDPAITSICRLMKNQCNNQKSQDRDPATKGETNRSFSTEIRIILSPQFCNHFF